MPPYSYKNTVWLQIWAFLRVLVLYLSSMGLCIVELWARRSLPHTGYYTWHLGTLHGKLIVSWIHDLTTCVGEVSHLGYGLYGKPILRASVWAIADLMTRFPWLIHVSTWHDTIRMVLTHQKNCFSPSNNLCGWTCIVNIMRSIDGSHWEDQFKLSMTF